MQGTYFRWTRTDGMGLVADILGVDVEISAMPSTGRVHVTLPEGFTASGKGIDADTARMIGVRLIEAAALAAGDRAIRER